jgi:hypothetical protein
VVIDTVVMETEVGRKCRGLRDGRDGSPADLDLIGFSFSARNSQTQLRSRKSTVVIFMH